MTAFEDFHFIHKKKVHSPQWGCFQSFLSPAAQYLTYEKPQDKNSLVPWCCNLYFQINTGKFTQFIQCKIWVVLNRRKVTHLSTEVKFTCSSGEVPVWSVSLGSCSARWFWWPFKRTRKIGQKNSLFLFYFVLFYLFILWAPAGLLFCLWVLLFWLLNLTDNRALIQTLLQWRSSAKFVQYRFGRTPVRVCVCVCVCVCTGTVWMWSKILDK